ncbi:MAG TPA: type II secretion system secretin GspD [Kofleriaceae bacterium]|jgi:general secretion pathway protein D|nr:type II secretion system secretin GspD [Kofleriaceae bacterium]
MRIIRSLTIIALAFATVQPAFAQPNPTPASNKDKDDKASGDDDSLYSCGKKTGDVSVTFKPETELKDLITWVMGFTCKNFVLNPSVVATGKKVTIIAPLKMSQHDAYRLFLVALSTMNLAVVPKGNVMRVVEAATAKSETLPIYRKGAPADEDQMVRYILQPSYAQVETVRAALDSVKSTAGSVTAVGNLIIITDYASQVRDMLSLDKAIDIPGNNEGVYTIPVLHSDATQLATKLNEILGIAPASPTAAKGVTPPPRPNTPAAPAASAAGASEAASSVPSKIIVDDRTNTLIVVGSEAAFLRVKSLVDRLDILLDTEGGAAIRVYPLQNALAKDLATTLNTALSNGASRPAGQGSGANRGPSQAAGAPPPPPTPGPAGDLGASLEGQVRVTNDDPTNSLIVMSSGRDYLAIKRVIHDLDQPRRQVYIEGLILQVTLEKDTSIGASSHGGLPTSSGNALILGGVESSSINSLAPSSVAALTGLIGGVVGSPLTNSQTFLGTSIPSYAILFQALATLDNTEVLSAPHTIAIDNEKTELSDGNNIPYQAGLSFGGLTSSSSSSTSGTSALPVGSIGQNIQREDLTLEFNVTPHISGQDSVRLEVEVNDKDLGSRDPQLGPTWTERKLKTQVVVHDQESVVIGGLIQEREVYSVTKVPLLGDIPLLGYLFKYQTTQKVKTDLLILLTPYIIKDRLDLEAVRTRKLQQYREFTASFSNLNEAKYEPNIDYRRKRGLVEEINRSLQSVEDDQELLNAAGHRQHVNEGAIEFHPGDGEEPAPPPAPPAGTK